jgi:hypothetical protein
MPDDPAPETAQSRAKVFISYSRKDIAFADRLEVALRARGFEPLIDRRDIAHFEEWWKRIEELILRCDTVVFVISPDAVKSTSVCRREVSFAQSLNKRLAPILWRATEATIVPEELRRLNWIDFQEDAQFEERMDDLAAALEQDIEWTRKHTEFTEFAQRWQSAGRPGPGGLMLRPPLLTEAEAFLIAQRPRGAPEPTLLRDFVAVSRRAYDEEQAAIAQSQSQLEQKQAELNRAEGALTTESGTVKYAIKDRPDLIVGYKSGVPEDVRGVRICVNADSTDAISQLMTSQLLNTRGISWLNVVLLLVLFMITAIAYSAGVFGLLPSVLLCLFFYVMNIVVMLGSPRYRLWLLRKEPGVSIEIPLTPHAYGYGGGMFPLNARVHADLGAIFVAEPDDLLKNRGVFRVIHVAVGDQRRELEGNVSLDVFLDCIRRVLARAERENGSLIRKLLKVAQLDSILIPIFRGSDDNAIVRYFVEAIAVVIRYFDEMPSPSLREIYFLAVRYRDKVACDRALEDLRLSGHLIRLGN